MDRQELAQQLLARATEQGIEVIRPDGLFNRSPENVLEIALEAEMEEHFGHRYSGRDNSVRVVCMVVLRILNLNVRPALQVHPRARLHRRFGEA